MGEQATIGKNTSRHSVTGYHVPDHWMARIHWALD